MARRFNREDVFCPVEMGGAESCDSCPKYKEDCDGQEEEEKMEVK